MKRSVLSFIRKREKGVYVTFGTREKHARMSRVSFLIRTVIGPANNTKWLTFIHVHVRQWQDGKVVG